MNVLEVPTRLGVVTLREERGVLWGIDLPRPLPGDRGSDGHPLPGGRGSECGAGAWLGQLAVAIQAHLSGQPVTYTLPPLPPLPPFQRDILTALFAIPWGHTTTYGALADAAGHPGAARAVGNVMAHNPWPLLFPCHRVLAAGGHLGGFSGGLDLKVKLLQLEGALTAAPGPLFKA